MHVYAFAHLFPVYHGLRHFLPDCIYAEFGQPGVYRSNSVFAAISRGLLRRQSSRFRRGSGCDVRAIKILIVELHILGLNYSLVSLDTRGLYFLSLCDLE